MYINSQHGEDHDVDDDVGDDDDDDDDDNVDDVDDDDNVDDVDDVDGVGDDDVDDVDDDVDDVVCRSTNSERGCQNVGFDEHANFTVTVTLTSCNPFEHGQTKTYVCTGGLFLTSV